MAALSLRPSSESESARSGAAGDRGVRVVGRGDGWLAVDKPSGLFVHRTRLGPETDVLLQRVRDAEGRRVSPVHRLDRPTSGVVLFGFDGEAVRGLQERLARPSAEKLYLALVRGAAEERFVVDRPLRADSGEPKAARTEATLLASLDGGRFSWLLVRPRTGRRHQIRRHLGGLAHHVLGDVRYGKGRLNRELRDGVGLRRLALHAWRLVLPAGGPGETPIVAEAGIPEDLQGPLGHWLGSGEPERLLAPHRRSPEGIAR